jgi:hypothetical protein
MSPLIKSRPSYLRGKSLGFTRHFGPASNTFYREGAKDAKNTKSELDSSVVIRVVRGQKSSRQRRKTGAVLDSSYFKKQYFARRVNTLGGAHPCVHHAT